MSECSRDRSSLLPPPSAALTRYAVVRALGHGGMADTFVARSIDPARSESVCLKRLKPALAADPAQRASFSDEARVLSRLCHPNVLSVLDAGTDLEGPFLVTELIDGLDLRRFLGWLGELGEPMPEAVALRIARDVADALAHAHEHGVLHRDVTPANVLLGRDGRVVLIDFGIARSDAQTQRTRTGLVKGKVAYMAPEQALGGTLDARTDLFALGVMLFEMLAGTRPHDGASDIETVTNALRGRHRALGRPLATSGLDAMIEALLHPQPAHRPGDAAFVVRALEGVRVADSAELAAWVRTACETQGGATKVVREEGTRRGVRARPETETTPELAIDTALAPAIGALDSDPSPASSTSSEPRSDASAWIGDWRPESEPPTTIEAARHAHEIDLAPHGHEGSASHGAHGPDANEAPPEPTEVCPRFDLEAAEHALDAEPRHAVSTSLGPPLLPAAAPSTRPSGRPRRMVVLVRTAAMLAGGVLAGLITGGAAAMLLRCVL